jgi:hypothetical protein
MKCDRDDGPEERERDDEDASASAPSQPTTLGAARASSVGAMAPSGSRGVLGSM